MGNEPIEFILSNKVFQIKQEIKPFFVRNA